MILIADSGSTKTHWSVVDRGRLVQQVFTKGMNPFFQTPEEMGEEIANALIPNLDSNKFREIHFFGAGCSPEKVPSVREVLSAYFDVEGEIEVDTDMLAAAKGLCGHKPGIVCILGTGSNSCFYDGEKIVDNVSPLGFILGDEGSGAVLGKRLVGDILKNQMGVELKEKFLKQFNVTQAEIIERVYRQPFPNRFLASVSPFLAENIQEPRIYQLVLSAFRAFLTRNVMQYDYKNNKAHFIGSIAFHYKEVLIAAAKEVGVEIGTIIQSPMIGLHTYYSEK
ncbi:ATPase [Bacteroides sp. 51]|uniref:ATPase n=1 Tax=Bacteroides sp. 51 TaxID=2302938 RepID=UPI0013CF9A2F|nr:ATPase [Bacteroides sp. 51]NDV81014.1 ATPase [Bacteroides sp. 51]